MVNIIYVKYTTLQTQSFRLTEMRVFVWCVMKVAKGVLYTGSSDHTARSWVIEFGDCARVYQGHEHTVGCVKFYNGLGAVQ